MGYGVDKVKDYGVDKAKSYVVDKNIEGVTQKNPAVGKRLEEGNRLLDPLKGPLAYANDRTLTRGRAQVTKCIPELVRWADEVKGYIGKEIDKATQGFKNDPFTKQPFNSYQEGDYLLKEPGRGFGKWTKDIGIVK